MFSCQRIRQYHILRPSLNRLIVATITGGNNLPRDSISRRRVSFPRYRCCFDQRGPPSPPSGCPPPPFPLDLRRLLVRLVSLLPLACGPWPSAPRSGGEFSSSTTFSASPHKTMLMRPFPSCSPGGRAFTPCFQRILASRPKEKTPLLV